MAITDDRVSGLLGVFCPGALCLWGTFCPGALCLGFHPPFPSLSLFLPILLSTPLNPARESGERYPSRSRRSPDLLNDFCPIVS